MNNIYKTFDSDRVMSRGQSDLGPLWPPRSPDLSVCDFFLWGTLKSKLYSNNPQNLQELQQNIADEISAITKVQLYCAFRNMLTRAQRCQEINGGHFQHFL
ncbi:hypothetical protein JTE90_019935 [Oedothorax gibbosus]|uniref:Uncharacterized protein n=1 Tax=Oedothorax gibbosus TaxID=931172 RepID=A0AAV6UQY7_9ARAC|nr:hypothetical protein JTE90_019935 [Oedothorax gibbosus]